jgi:RHH-type proline utilization regulon transcriptional repressor/proline dehydrogenase/delta 1-pyrroline-5-carboxylate dehydrogenase
MAPTLETRIRETGARLYALMEGDSPSAFSKDFWTGKAMEWTMRDPDFKTRLFRFVDVFPSLEGSADIARHAREYFGDADGGFIGRMGLKALGNIPGASAIAARILGSNIDSMARQFIAGADADDALGKLDVLRTEGLAFTIALLGEAVVSEGEADDYQRRYTGLLEKLAAAAESWATIGDGGALDWGAKPRVNISVKPSALYSQMNPRAFDHSVEKAASRLRPLVRKAVELGAALTLDMEHRDFKDLTLALYRRIMEEDEFAGYPHTGLAIQAYLRDTPDDLRSLVAWARDRRQPLTVRLVKGAYWDSEVALARQRNWPEPVYLVKRQSDAAFETAVRTILENHEWVKLACGSHNVRSVASAIETARELGIPADDLEFQVLYGMGEPVRNALVRFGQRVRLYTPVGEMIPGMAYLVRRLIENTSNESFLRQGFVEGKDREELLASPADPGSHAERPPRSADSGRSVGNFANAGTFVNEPLLDWSREENRAKFSHALASLRKRFPLDVPVVVGGKTRVRERFESFNPNDADEVVARVQAATPEDLEDAVARAGRAFPAWRDRPPSERAGCLFKAAELARKRRMELAALEVLEAGKNWDEADADVCEAIDFLEYYGREMLRLGEGRDLSRVPGESSTLVYEPCGVAAVIAPWNFPLAISMGMVSAAIVAGNTVVYKPSSESAATGLIVSELFDRAGLPQGVLNFLPGSGSVLGDALVTHPDVWLVAFTGSRDVGLRIHRLAAEASPKSRFVKRVIAEMGGKNAIIVDTDADLDAALRDVVHSAFGYQGQKCSACSRLIVLEPVYDTVVDRLRDAAGSLVMGRAEDPATTVGAVISEAARVKIARYVEIGAGEGRLVVERMPAGINGHTAPLAIFADIRPEHRLAQEEIFGPVLSVMKARDLDDAIEIANGTRYALTGAIFSRSPENIRRASERFRVGNLYVNRGSTGAIVGRHPFGGFRMSGVGSKAGGPDYLAQFMVPRSVVENTIRRAFTPEIDGIGGEETS